MLDGVFCCASATDTPNPFDIVLKLISAEVFRNPRLDMGSSWRCVSRGLSLALSYCQGEVGNICAKKNVFATDLSHNSIRTLLVSGKLFFQLNWGANRGFIGHNFFAHFIC